jgi:hypothetical protein
LETSKSPAFQFEEFLEFNDGARQLRLRDPDIEMT